MVPKTKIIVSQTNDQRITAADLLGLEMQADNLYKLDMPLYVIFDETSPAASMVKLYKDVHLFIVQDSWDKEELDKQLQQKMETHNYVVMFQDDYKRASSEKMDAFDACTLPHFNKIFKFSLDMLRSPTIQNEEADPKEVSGKGVQP